MGLPVRSTRRQNVIVQLGKALRSGFVLLAVLCPSVLSAMSAETKSLGRSCAHQQHSVQITEASRRFGIPEHWIRVVLCAESNGNVRAVSPVGALGLMQVMPPTWIELRKRHRLGDDPYEPHDNIMAGTAYLRELYDRYGSVSAMLAAYHAGPGRYDAFLSRGRALPLSTRVYVAALLPFLSGDALPRRSKIAVPTSSDWRTTPLFPTARSGPETTAGRPAGLQFSEEIFTDRNPRGDAQ